jgi:hypothetical protein
MKTMNSCVLNSTRTPFTFKNITYSFLNRLRDFGNLGCAKWKATKSFSTSNKAMGIKIYKHFSLIVWQPTYLPYYPTALLPYLFPHTHTNSLDLSRIYGFKKFTYIYIYVCTSVSPVHNAQVCYFKQLLVPPHRPVSPSHSPLRFFNPSIPKVPNVFPKGASERELTSSFVLMSERENSPPFRPSVQSKVGQI